MPAKPLHELAASVELLCRNVIDEDCAVAFADMQNARELVRRMRDGVAKCEAIVAAPATNNATTNRRMTARVILAALTGATEETKSDG
jgi:hypothetical protein